MTENFVTEICCGYRAVYLAVIAEWSARCASEYQEHIYIYIYNCRQRCFGLLGLISAVLLSRMEVKLKKPPQMSHTCGTSKPCQSAQTSELASVRNIYLVNHNSS